MKEKHAVAVIGNYPPPIGGAAKNTEIISNALSEVTEVIKLDTSVGGLTHTKSLGYHIRRIKRTVYILKRLVKLKKYKQLSVYIVPDGGVGIVYTFLYFLVCRLSSYKVYCHHRTFQYIDSYKIFAAISFALIRQKARHIFLSESMAAKFMDKYPFNGEVLISDNSRYVQIIEDVKKSGGSNLILGHLSNLCDEKGVHEVLAVFDLLAPVIPDLKLIVGGEAVDSLVQKDINLFQSRWGERVEFVGYVNGEKKRKVYDEIDIFLFPTKFKQEAQPNVIYEAMSRGCVCVSWERGCISDMYTSSCGEAISRSDDYIKSAVQYIEQLI